MLEVADATPFGTVVAISGADPPVIELNHDLPRNGDQERRLQNKDRVRLIGPGEARREAYVGRVHDNSLALYADVKLTQASSTEGLKADASVIKLMPEDWAVIIALNWYFDKGLKPLQGPHRDADLFEQWVKDQACVPDAQVRRPEASKMEILAENGCMPTASAAQKLFSKFADDAYLNQDSGGRIGRRLYIFCSGHGAVPTFTERPDYHESPLLTAEAAYSNGWNHLLTRWYAEYFRAGGIFDQVLLFTDCCRNPQISMAAFQPRLPPLRPQREPGRGYYATGAELGSRAWEQPLGNPPQVRGVFSYVLMEALGDGALCNEDGALTGTMLSNHLHTRVPTFSNKQSPQIEYDPKLEEIVILKRANYVRPEAVIKFAARHVGKEAKLYGAGNLRTPIDTDVVAQDGIWRVHVDVGKLYKIAVEGTSGTFETLGAMTDVCLD
jgi:hypothetical protein